MSKVVIGLSVSVDGFIAGPNDGSEYPLGVGGETLFEWMDMGPESNRVHEYIKTTNASKPVVDEWLRDAGAIISGRRTFDIANGWYYGHPIDVPIFVVTHEVPTEGKWSPKVTFVTDGIERALELAQEAAGDKVISANGANPVQQLFRMKKVDQVQISVAPVLLGSGVRLFDHLGEYPIQLTQTRVLADERVTHLRYDVHYG
jgi:dihydrofolate reductase